MHKTTVVIYVEDEDYDPNDATGLTSAAYDRLTAGMMEAEFDDVRAGAE